MEGPPLGAALLVPEHFQVKWIRLTVENASLERKRADST
jgi:hypothetical protein